MLGKNRLPSGNADVPDLTSLSSGLPSLRLGLSSLYSGLSYYDVALAVLPVPLLVGFLAEELLALTPGTGVLVGAAASALVVGYLLFGNPPMRRGPSTNHDPPARRDPRRRTGEPSA